MIEVKSVTKRYGDIVAVNNISFTAESGKIYGFLGPNGAGKTTTMSIITGCLAATSGTVTIEGHDIYEEPYEAKKALGYMPEVPPLYPEMTPREYLWFVGEAKGVKKDELGKQIDSALRRVRIADVKDRLIRNLSKGYRQRVGFAQAIIGHPRTIILDEPTAGLDPRQIIEMRELIRDLRKDHTVVLSSHILSEVSAVCDYILIISKGNLVASDTTENLLRRFHDRNALNLTVKGAPEMIRSALSGLDGVANFAVKEQNERGESDVTIELADATDRRDRISRALINSDCLILSMTGAEISLEDVFLRLTNERNRGRGSDAGGI